LQRGGASASTGLENVDNPNKVDPKSKYLKDLVRFVLHFDFKKVGFNFMLIRVKDYLI
tara:strand:+ start:23 stop:196 length:174 start_codon:yes stop_codon:yes gene_type:complete